MLKNLRWPDNNYNVNTSCLSLYLSFYIMLDLKFFERKTNMLILSGLREDHIGVTMFPAALNTRSDGVLVAMASYLASIFNHQASGSSLTRLLTR